MSRWVSVLAAMTMAGCYFGGDDGGHRPPIDDDPDDGIEHDADPNRTCTAIRADYQALIAGRDLSCDEPSDCMVYLDDEITCDCFPHLTTNCSGDVFSVASFDAIAPQLAALDEEFYARCPDGDVCFEIPCTCDCAPQSATCGENGTCVATGDDSCL
jgi:hypothetical protein